VTPKGQGRNPDIFRWNISKKLTDRGLITVDSQYEIAYGESIGHLIDYVT